jgi:pimeloyl-ACP methyl ester carboxylesterase
MNSQSRHQIATGRILGLFDAESGPRAILEDASGTRQVAGFFGAKSAPVFGVVHLPKEPTTAGVVVCPALHSDFERTYRRDVLLSRALAERGYAVHRFHYRGMGNSHGPSTDTTFGTMREDALAAAERLRYLTGVNALGFVGTRWGGLIAGSAAVEHDGSPLALWEPTTDGTRYFREAGRARAIRDAKEGQPPTPWDDLIAELRAEGRIDVLGYAIEAALYESAISQTLSGVLGDRPRPILLIQMRAARGLRADYASLVAMCEQGGFPFEIATVEREEEWWFSGNAWEAIEARASTIQMIDSTTGWMTKWLPTA